MHLSLHASFLHNCKQKSYVYVTGVVEEEEDHATLSAWQNVKWETQKKNWLTAHGAEDLDSAANEGLKIHNKSLSHGSHSPYLTIPRPKLCWKDEQSWKESTPNQRRMQCKNYHRPTV